MTVWILIGPDGKPYKGAGWRRTGHVKAFDNVLSAKISAGLAGKGVTAKEVSL